MQNPRTSLVGQPPRVVTRRLARLLALALLSVIAGGCQRADSVATGTAAAQPVATRQQAKISPVIWDVFYLQGSKIGYGRTEIAPVERDGRTLVETKALNHLSLKRFGQQSEQNVTMTTLEGQDGELVQFQTTLELGTAPTVVTGKVAGQKLKITTTSQGRQQSSSLPWSAEIRGFRGVEKSLSAKPLRPGEKRSLKMLMPIFNQVADVELVAAERENTPVLGIEMKLLRIESVSRLPGGQKIESTLWTDEQGEVIKTRMAALDQESFRTTEQVAVAPTGAADNLDLGLDLFVKLDPPLARPHGTREVVYRVELASGDPAQVFASGPTQQVTSLGPHTAQITVRSLRPGDENWHSAEAAKAEAPSPEYTEANSVLQLDDPGLKKLAAEARGDAKTPAEIAVALEKFVHGAVSEKNFTHAFASAAEVAESKSGDCTEHAVLLAALARICGLPSRVAIGLVYVERAQGFGFHMWTEVFLDGRWVPLDATLGAGGTSAAYLKLNDSSLAGAGAYSSFLSVAQVLGQLKVSVVSAK